MVQLLTQYFNGSVVNANKYIYYKLLDLENYWNRETTGVRETIIESGKPLPVDRKPLESETIEQGDSQEGENTLILK